ncbi:MAG TPA: hypothetical protein PKA37_06475, partial [Planctomycetota bacterium]|nr:hypothetical protein [Planctomycetota bacterium]
MRSEPILLFSSLSFDAELMARLLDANDARVVRTADTGSALRAAQTESLSLAILDCGMPEIAWKPVRGVLEKRGVPVLLVQPPGGTPPVASSASSIARPIDTGEFPRRVQRALRGESAGRRGIPNPG